MLGDKAYDGNAIRDLIEGQGAVPNIPAKSNRKWKPCFSKTLYRERNQVERFFALITEKQIRRGVHRSTQALERDIIAFIDTHNADPKPFRWTKSADDILAAIQRFCQRTLQIGGTTESGH